MEQTKHTPGPWTVDDTHAGYIVADKHPSQAQPLIAKMHESSHIEASEREANARLIAAAPDLLAALEATYRHLRNNADPMVEVSDLYNTVCAAMAKATAQQ